MSKEKQSKREMILKAAYELFVKKGYLDAKIIDIADAAGIGKGTVYEYFDSKNAIFMELFKTEVAAGYEKLPELLNAELDCENKLRKYIEVELENTSRYTFSKNFVLDLLLKSDAFQNPALIESINRLMTDKFQIMHQIIEEGIQKGEFRNSDPLLATVAISGAVHHFISLKFCPLDLSQFTSESQLGELDQSDFLALILNGLKA